ncbi:MAG: hypothetical protein WBA07_14435 [Rivularia sp. (in: cyanobacteria)]
METAFNIAFGLSISLIFAASPAWCETKEIRNNKLDINPEVIENSPVLQRWLNEVPNVLQDIKNQPSFRTRLRSGYFQSDGDAGVKVGFEDVFVVDKLTVSGEYQKAFNNNFENYGADLNYYLLPLGGYLNFSPLVGYRNLQTSDYSTSGVNLGVKLLLVLSRGGGADIAFTRSWVVDTESEVTLTKLSASYAITNNRRFSTELG